MTNQTKPLTAREQDVFGLLQQGKQNREIAQNLNISVVAVEQHLTSIYRKLGVRNRLEAVIHANQTNNSTGSHSIQDEENSVH